MRLLLAEDDPSLVAMLRRALTRRGDVLDVATTGDDALWMGIEGAYDVVILDVNIPPPDGFAVCRRLRAAEIWTPVLFLTGRTDVLDRVVGLDAGADDYLVKPFVLDELNARLRALTRRQPSERPAVLRADDVEVDPATRRVRRAGVEVELTPKEFSLLELLVRRQDRVVSRREVVEALWDFAFDPTSNVVEALVRRLRQKIDSPFGRTSIVTVRGAGYRFGTESPAADASAEGPPLGASQDLQA